MTLLSRLFAGEATQQDLGRLQQVGAFLSSFGAAAGQAGSRGQDTFGGLAGALGAGSQGLAAARRNVLQERALNAQVKAQERREKEAQITAAALRAARKPDGTIDMNKFSAFISERGGNARLVLDQLHRDRSFNLRVRQHQERLEERRKDRAAANTRSAANRNESRLAREESRKAREERAKLRADEKAREKRQAIARRVDTAFEKRAEAGGAAGAAARSEKGQSLRARARKFALDGSARTFGEAIDKANKERKRLVDAAASAIRNGADQSAVLQRLKENGVEGLSTKEKVLLGVSGIR